MENKRQAVQDVLGLKLRKDTSRKFFFNVYEYLLYNEPEDFLEVLNFRMGMKVTEKPHEDYHLFKFMLQLLLKRNTAKLLSLCPLTLEPETIQALNLPPPISLYISEMAA